MRYGIQQLLEVSLYELPPILHITPFLRTFSSLDPRRRRLHRPRRYLRPRRPRRQVPSRRSLP